MELGGLLLALEAVATTWQLNIEYIRIQSEDECLGSAAMEIVDIINVGMPQIDDEFIDALQRFIRCKVDCENFDKIFIISNI